MKKIYLAYLAFGISLLVSCNKDDDPKVDPIIGEWEMRFLKIEILNNEAAADTLNGNVTPIFYTQGNASRIILNILQDKTFEETWRLLDGSDATEEGEWEKTESNISLSYDVEENEFTIQKIDEDDLELVSLDLTQYSVPDPDFPEDQNKTINLDAKITFVYEKK